LHKLTSPGADEPVQQPAAFYDLQGSNTIAGSVAMALFKRERTGEPSVVDVSLINTGMWAMSPDIAAAPFLGGEIPRADRRGPGNPIVNYYRTKDARWINLVCLQGDRFWGELCAILDRADLIIDERFIDSAARFENRFECVAQLDAIFAERTMAEWQQVLEQFSGVWAPAVTPLEVHDHPQVAANGYLPELTAEDGSTFRVVAPPYQFDEQLVRPRGRAPDLGADTDALLSELGLDETAIAGYRDSGALGKGT
jgi:formyl-CoA transferase